MSDEDNYLMQELVRAARKIHRCDLALCLLIILLKAPKPSYFLRCTNSVVLYLLVLTQSRQSHWYGLWSYSPCLGKKLSHTGTAFPNSDFALQPRAAAYVNSTTRPLSRSNLQHLSDGEQLPSHELRLSSQRQCFLLKTLNFPPAASALSPRIERGLLACPTSSSGLCRFQPAHQHQLSKWPTLFSSENSDIWPAFISHDQIVASTFANRTVAKGSQHKLRSHFQLWCESSSHAMCKSRIYPARRVSTNLCR